MKRPVLSILLCQCSIKWPSEMFYSCVFVICPPAHIDLSYPLPG